MSKVLFLYERMMPTVADMRERFKDIFSQDQEAVEHRFLSVKDINKKDLSWFDVLVLIRPDNYLSYKIASIAAKHHKTIIFFMDDDLLNIPKKVLPSIPWRIKSLKKNIILADVFLSPSDYILDKYVEKTTGKRRVRIDTAISQEEIALLANDKKLNDKVKIVYAAGGDHGKLFEEYLKPILPELDEKYADKISLTFFGVKPNINPEDYKMAIDFIPSMPLQEYRQKMIASNFDIGLAPLHNDDFSKCKYFNKYIEYVLTGVVGIYSNVEPYTYVVKDGENGFLADNEPQSWLIKISEAIESDERQRILNNSKKHIIDHFKSEKIAAMLKKSIPEFYQSEGKETIKVSIAFSKIKYKIFRVFDTIYLVFYYLKRDGLKGLFGRIKYHRQENKSIKGM